MNDLKSKGYQRCPNLCRISSAQGTIEYLVIIAVVIVISLVVVGLLVTQIDSASSVSSDTGRISGMTSSIGITESLVHPSDGNFVVRLLNNSGGLITVSNVRVGDSNTNFSEDLAQGGSKYFGVDSSVVCEEGTVLTEDVVVSYYTRHGLLKTEHYPSKVFFDCTPFVVNQAMLADRCPSGGSCSLDGNASDANVLSGYTFYSDDPDNKLTGSILTITPSNSSTLFSSGFYASDFNLSVVDSNLGASNILDSATIFGITGTASAGGGGAELHSGQTSCYDASNNPDSCPPSSGPANQDAQNDGTAKDYTNNGCGGGTVLDNHTGLCWQKDHKDNCAPLTWENALSYCSTLANGSGGLTDGSSAGDWRVPSNVELITLADYSYPSSRYLNSVFTQTGWNSTCYGYWSSTTVPSSTSSAYILHSNGGFITFVNKTNGINDGVRCVRSE
jgi:hypothetical protein